MLAEKLIRLRTEADAIVPKLRPVKIRFGRGTVVHQAGIGIMHAQLGSAAHKGSHPSAWLWYKSLCGSRGDCPKETDDPVTCKNCLRLSRIKDGP